MAATGGEAASADHIGSESLWIPRAGRSEERKDERRKNEGRKRKLRIRANLNGGEVSSQGKLNKEVLMSGPF